MRRFINRTVRAEIHGFKRHRTTSSVPAPSECNTRRLWLLCRSHNPVTVQPAEAQPSEKMKHWESFWEQQKTPIEAIYYLLDLRNGRWSKPKRISIRCRIPRIHSTVLSMKKRCRLARDKSWMAQVEQSLRRVWRLTELIRVRDWAKHIQLRELLRDYAAREPRHKLPWIASLEKTVQKYKCSSKPTANHMASWSTRTAQSQGAGLIWSSRSSRVQGLNTKAVVPTESWPLVWPVR